MSAADRMLDALARESFHTFFTQRLGYEGDSWAAAHVVCRIVDGTPIETWTEAERTLYASISGGRKTLPVSLRELHLILGRGAGKSTIEAALVCYAATRRYPGLGPGERPRVWLLAGDQEQATVLRDYVLGMFESDPQLDSLVLRPFRQDKITLANGVTIQIRAAHWKKVRGPTLALVAADELAFWWSEELAANPDQEVLRAVRPGLLKLPGGGGLLVCGTTPYMQQGAAWQAFEQHFGREHPRILVLHAPTLTFRPTMDREAIAAAVADDPLAASEWNAEWRSDVATFLSSQAVDAVMDHGTHEREPEPDVEYTAFVDVSGGAERGDSWALAITHVEDGVGVLDLVREVKPAGAPLNPRAVIAEWTPTLEAYGLTSVTGDRYGGQLTKELFAEHGFVYEDTPLAKSDLYREALPAINAGKVRLLDHPVMRTQLLRLVRKPRQGGRDVIDHPPGGHDDVANVTAGALVLALGVGEPKRPKKLPKFMWA